MLWPEREHGGVEDDADPRVVHLLARDASGAVVGTVRVHPEPCPWRPGVEPSWQLRSMATHPDARSTGVGRALVEEAVARVRSAGGRVLWCDARAGATGFYERLGFALASEAFVKDERPHRGMVLDL